MATSGKITTQELDDSVIDDLRKATSSGGVVSFTTKGNHTWTCPEGVTKVWLTMFGGGAGGTSMRVVPSGTADSVYYAEGPGGGGGAYCVRLPVVVVPGTEYPIIVGAGGAGGVPTYPYTGFGSGSAGGASSALGLTANGGTTPLGGTATGLMSRGANGYGSYSDGVVLIPEDTSFAKVIKVGWGSSDISIGQAGGAGYGQGGLNSAHLGIYNAGSGGGGAGGGKTSAVGENSGRAAATMNGQSGGNGIVIIEW